MNWPGLGFKGDGSPQARRVAAARKGDRQAFEDLKAEYELPLLRFVQRRVGAHACDDITQDTWISAWQGIARFDRRSSFKAWVFAIAGHKCLDYHRSAARDAQRGLVGDLSIDYADPHNAYEAAELRHTVQAIIGVLPAAQREVLELYYYDDLSLPEIAGVLTRNLNTVKYQFYRAHALVAGELEGFSPGSVPGKGAPKR